MKRIFVCSPFRARGDKSTEDHIKLAWKLMRIAVVEGHAPWAPHLTYPKVLNDENEIERRIGINAGLSWLAVADELWIYANNLDECSNGMIAEIAAAKKFCIPPKEVWMPDCWRGASL